MIKHEDLTHAVGCFTEVKGQCETWVIVTPKIEFEVVVLVVGQRRGLAVPVGAAPVVIGVTRGCLGSDPLLRTCGRSFPSEKEGVVCDIVHVMGEKEDRIGSRSESFDLMKLALEFKVDRIWCRELKVKFGSHFPGAIFGVPY